HQLHSGLLQLSAHPHAFPEVGKYAYSPYLTAVFLYDCSRKICRHLFTIFPDQSYSRGGELAGRAIFAAAQAPPSLLCHCRGEKLIHGIWLTYHFVGAVPQNPFGRIIVNQNFAFKIGYHDSISRTHDDTVKKTVGAEQFTFDLNTFGQILEIHKSYVAIAKLRDSYAGFKYAFLRAKACGGLEHAAKTSLPVKLRIDLPGQ